MLAKWPNFIAAIPGKFLNISCKMVPGFFALQVCGEQGFCLATQAVAVSLLDRFLCRTLVQRQDAWAVQLAAVACLTIASKYEQVCTPSQVIAFQVTALNVPNP